MSGKSKRDSNESISKTMWEEIDSSFQDTLKYADQAYKTNYYINLIIVGIGIVLLASSLVFSWTSGLNPATLTYAGLGIADFVALFLVNPQTRIQQLVGDLDQILVVYRTWRDQLDVLDTYARNKNYALTFEETVAYDSEMGRVASHALSALETYIGAKQPASAAQSDAGTATTKPAANPPEQKQAKNQ
jgi:low temperature requirement protein LtrA